MSAFLLTESKDETHFMATTKYYLSAYVNLIYFHLKMTTKPENCAHVCGCGGCMCVCTHVLHSPSSSTGIFKPQNKQYKSTHKLSTTYMTLYMAALI